MYKIKFKSKQLKCWASRPRKFSIIYTDNGREITRRQIGGVKDNDICQFCDRKWIEHK